MLNDVKAGSGVRKERLLYSKRAEKPQFLGLLPTTKRGISVCRGELLSDYEKLRMR